MKILHHITIFALCIISFISCKTTPEMTKEEKIQHELAVLDSLLQDPAYAVLMAETLDAAYYTGTGQTPPPFLAKGEDTAVVAKSVREEKIAINLAGFYALECAIGYLCEDKNITPVECLQQILSNKAGDTAILLLDRFANATWKAGQPFRSPDRIKRPNFIGASGLSEDEIRKDTRQIISASAKLLPAMQPAGSENTEQQMQWLRKLLQDISFATEIAAYQDSAYYAGENKPAPPFITTEESVAVVQKPVIEQKIATNLAGFYALECAVNYIVTTQNRIPSEVLQAIIEDKLSAGEKNLFARFANATWKAGQPFRGLERITRDIFTPFYFLAKEDVEKDYVQLKAAAKKLLETLEKS